MRAGAYVEVLHPSRADGGLEVNDRSLVLRIAFGGASLLVPGDLERRGERRVRASGLDLSADALVVGHHGSAGSSSPEFLEAVRPRAAVISVGFANPFGHPGAAVVERLRAARVRVQRTDRDGRVVLRPGPGDWSIETWIRRESGEPE